MTAITTRLEPCWTLVQPDGRNVSEYEPHFDSGTDAIAAAPRYTDDDEPAPTPKRLDHLCSTATLACGYRYDEGGEGVEHWSGADKLRDHLLGDGYRHGADGMLRCPAGYGCDRCDALPDAPDLIPLAGQLDLLGGEVR